MVSVAHMSVSWSSFEASTFKRVWTICHWYLGMPQGRGSIGWRGSVYPGTWHMRLTGAKAALARQQPWHR
jgi:hypothetical protein